MFDFGIYDVAIGPKDNGVWLIVFRCGCWAYVQSATGEIVESDMSTEGDPIWYVAYPETCSHPSY